MEKPEAQPSSPRDGLAARSPIWISAPAFLLALAILAFVIYWHFSSVLNCLDCFVDLEGLHGAWVGRWIQPDTRLNAWILAWVQRALTSAPFSLLEANAFHPAAGTLAGSEHLIGVALQLLPLRLYTRDAVAMHQLALLFSSCLLVLGSFLCVRGLTRSLWAGVLAGLAALLMPWRIVMASHLQLASAGWIPLIWWLVLRGLQGQGGRREAWLLAGVALLQLLSSFYLAYFLTLSLAVLGLLVALQGRLQRVGLRRTALALAPGYALLMLSALPYLQRDAAGEIPDAGSLLIAPGDALALLAPTLLPEPLGPPLRQAVPLGVALLALVALGFALASWRRSRQQQEEEQPELRVAVFALCAVVPVAFLLMLGNELVLGDWRVPLPAAFLAELVPGFDKLRNTARWGILIGLAMPLLAGIGAAQLARACSAGKPGRRLLAQAAVSLLVLATLPRERIPVAPAWSDPKAIDARYRMLEELPPGPLLELPWVVEPVSDCQHSSRALLGSTRHWRPLLNGCTGHAPDSYHFLRRLASNLPSRHVLQKLRALTGVRWFLLRVDDMQARWLWPWDAGVKRGLLREVARDPHTRILELLPTEQSGVWQEALRSAEFREQTFAGHSRAALAPADAVGSLVARLPERFARTGFMVSLVLELHNQGGRTWPGFDYDTEGLVLLRHTLGDPRSGESWTGISPLDQDIPVGKTVAVKPFLPAPRQPGRYTLCLDLVQEVQGRLQPLAVPPHRQDVHFEGPAAEEARPRFVQRGFRSRLESPLDPCGS